MTRTRFSILAATGALAALVGVADPVAARAPVIQVNPGTQTSANELVIAINPANPNEVAIGANIDFHFRSSDGGQTWTENHITSSFRVWGDPCLVYDADGNLFYGHLSYPSFGAWIDRIVVQKSTDNGLTWSDGFGVGHNPPAAEDKEWIAVDRTDSAWRHNLYMSWTEFDSYGSASPQDSTRILFSRSTDRGETWSSPLRLSERGGNCIDEDETVEGAVPAVGPEGQIYVAWSGHDEILFDRSFDAGLTFGSDIFITDQPGGWDFNIGGISRCNGMPITACDTSNSPWRGRIYVLFSDQRHGSDDTDVFLCTSDDQGTTWTVPRRVNSDAGASQQFFPWLAVDPVTGLVTVVYYDRSETSGDATDVIVAWSRDGGDSFITQKVNETSFTPTAGVFFGDYIGIDVYSSVIHATWLALEGSQRTVWTARLAFPSGVGGLAARQTALLMRMPATVTNRQTTIAFTTWQDGPVRLAIYDIRGRLVRELLSEGRPAGEHRVQWDSTDSGGRRVASGMYIARLASGADTVTKKVVVVN